MKIELKIDYEGRPYIELFAERRDLEGSMLELFIRQAYEKGIVIQNEADCNTRNDYASIRIKEIET